MVRGPLRSVLRRAGAPGIAGVTLALLAAACGGPRDSLAADGLLGKEILP